MQTQAGGRAPGLVVGQFQVLVRIKAIETLINFPKKKKNIGVSTQLVGCTPQAYEACACPTSIPKKEPGVGNRDTTSLMDGGAYLSEARSGSNTPRRVVEGRQNVVTVFAPRGKTDHQVGSLITRETNGEVHPSPCL